MEKENPGYKEKVLSFLQGKLTPKEEEELLELLKADRNHRTLFLQMQETLREEVVQTRDEQVDRQWEKLTVRLFREQEESIGAKREQNFRVRQILSIAAAFILGLLISGVFYFSWKDKSVFDDQLVQEISIPYGAKTNFNLPDGSSVWLNSGSTLSFSSKFSGDRTVSLEGEAYFDVVKSGKPFLVSTNYGTVKVMGTSFDVKAYSDGEFQSTLVKGTVRVNRPNSESVVLHPGQQSYLNEAGRLSVKEVNPELFTSWKEGRLIFYREPFVQMARRLERWYNIKIEINDKELEDLRFTGTIEMETLSEVMELVRRTMPVKYSYDRNTRLLKIYKK